jgi:hypothetical protein
VHVRVDGFSFFSCPHSIAPKSMYFPDDGKPSTSARKDRYGLLSSIVLKLATQRLQYRDALQPDARHNTPAPILDEFGRNDFCKARRKGDRR